MRALRPAVPAGPHLGGGAVSRQVFRIVIPVDDSWHTVELHGPILHVATRDARHVEVWFLDDPAQPGTLHHLRVFGTGRPLPDEAVNYVGTALAPGGQLVWHLFESREVAS